jgi:hypothetical protein
VNPAMDELEALLWGEYQRISMEAKREGLIATSSSRLQAAALVVAARTFERMTRELLDGGPGRRLNG